MFVCKFCALDPDEYTVRVDAVTALQEVIVPATASTVEVHVDPGALHDSDPERTRCELAGQQALDEESQEEKKRRLELEIQEQRVRIAMEMRMCEEISKKRRQVFEREKRERDEAAAAKACIRKALVAKFLYSRGFVAVDLPKRRLFRGFTYPLHAAASEGDPTVVEMLLREGAYPYEKDSSGNTAAQVAENRDKDGSHTEVVKLLRSAPDSRLTLMWSASTLTGGSLQSDRSWIGSRWSEG